MTNARQADREIVRNAAKRVAEIAALPVQAEKIRLWTACNDLKPERPVVLAREFPWEEIERKWLTLECEDPRLREIEFELKRRAARHEHVPDDCPVLDAYKIFTKMTGDGYDDYGMKLLTTKTGIKGGSYHIEQAIKTDADAAKLHPRPIRVEHATTQEEFEFVADVIGDIMNVQMAGRTYWRYGLTRVLIHMRGLDQMMLDMYDHPGLLHRLMTLLRNDNLREIDIFERERAIGLNATPDRINGTGGLGPVSDLPHGPLNENTRVCDCICWAESQETVGISPAQFDEFVLQYQIPLMQRFGLVDYGCCEPLEAKLDLLIEKIPNLRWVAVAPWADRQVCADKIQNDYVYVYKASPTRICSPQPDWPGAEKELRDTLKIAAGCPLQIVMKDVGTLCNEPDRITRWCEIAMRAIEEAE